tara:strand:+ start:390 stop:707 length:318 start_codon:yes stop_codon:yes gene_type:complete
MAYIDILTKNIGSERDYTIVKRIRVKYDVLWYYDLDCSSSSFKQNYNCFGELAELKHWIKQKHSYFKKRKQKYIQDPYLQVENKVMPILNKYNGDYYVDFEEEYK